MKRIPDRLWRTISVLAFLLAGWSLSAQSIFGTLGDPVPPDVEQVYQKGLKYLASSQSKEGDWRDGYGSQPGVVSLAMLAMLAHGEDPNYGPYADSIKRCLDVILKQQNPANGYIGGSMYNHGFATLGLAEAYGYVQDERIGPALERAVGLILSSQESNPYGAWRYNPGGNDADTTVSGACLVALYAAQNAGVAVPPKAIERALKYYTSCACPEGGFGYTGADSPNGPRAAIGILVFALARRYQSREMQRSLEWFRTNGTAQGEHYLFYYLYYTAQALFQTDMAYWREWNSQNTARLRQLQAEDGSFKGNHGEAFSTAAALLSLALNYRFLPIYER
jgi:hypothetical protein